MSIYGSDKIFGLSSDAELFSIRRRDDGTFELISSDGKVIIAVSSREEAELVAMTPALEKACYDKRNWNLPFAYFLDDVLAICASHRPSIAWTHMRTTADEIKKTIEPQHERYERWQAQLLHPRCVPFWPFSQAVEDMWSSSDKTVPMPNPLPQLHTLADDEIAALREWIPYFNPGVLFLDDLKIILMQGLKHPLAPRDLGELSMKDIVRLLKNAPAEGQHTAFSESTAIRNAIIFYSWQSHLPLHLNQDFIGGALKDAAKAISDEFPISLSVHHDTRELAGSPDIFNSILEKIDNSDVFVCDVSIVSRCSALSLKADASSENKDYMNSNVAIELGYALAELGSEKILMVFNEASGDTGKIPFDLGYKRQVLYQAEGSIDEDRTAAINALAGKLEDKLVQILAGVIEENMALRVWQKLGGYQRSFSHLQEKLGPEYTIAFLQSLPDNRPEDFKCGGITDKGSALYRA